MTEGDRRGVFVPMFGSAVIVRALLSATNLLVGLILIRHTSNSEYGQFVLITTGVLLLSGLQHAFIQPPMVIHITNSSQSERADLIGGLYRGQRTILHSLLLCAVILITVLWLTGIAENKLTLIAIAAVAALGTALYREFFRMVLLSYRRPYEVLKADLCYVIAVLVGVPLATQSSAPAASAIFAISLAAIIGGFLLSRALWRYEKWNRNGPASMLREMAPLGKWSSIGSGIHWTFSQGYNYVVAGTLEAGAVAALAATRLLMMPINLLSFGIASQMLPTSSHWLQTHGPAVLFRRLILISSGLGAVALCYSIAVWFLRGFLFDQVMHKQFEQSDILIMLWSAVFLVMVFRDQLHFLLGARGLHRLLTGVTGVSAIISLAVGFVVIQFTGAIGAPIGVLIGEICNLLGIVYLSLQEIGRQRTAMPSGSKVAKS